ncbi:MAG: hypothetical protein HYZ21_02145, partial [Chloroflexi bacterium]|nr:hypothetical protein [Chloroflexota bacterium]
MSPSKKAKRSAGSKVQKGKGSKVVKGKGVRRKQKEESAPKSERQPSGLPTSEPANSVATNALRVLAILVVIGITVYIYSIRERVEDFAAYGYPGIFLIALMAN